MDDFDFENEGFRLDELFDPAEVEELRVPAVPLIGIPLIALASTRSCAPSDCRFEWSRADGSQGGEGTVVGRSRCYVPTDADTGSVLRVRATPPDAAAEAIAVLGREAEAATVTRDTSAVSGRTATLTMMALKRRWRG